MDTLYIRSYFVVVVVGMFCWLNASVVSAQTATDLNCAGCVGFFEFAPGVRTRFFQQEADIAQNRADIVALTATLAAQTPDADLTGTTYCLFGQGTWLSAGNGSASVTANPFSARLDFTSSTQVTVTGIYDRISSLQLPSLTITDAVDPFAPEMLTYTVVGNRLAIAFTDNGDVDTSDFTMTPDAQVFVGGFFERSVDVGVDFWETGMIVGVRAASCN